LRTARSNGHSDNYFPLFSNPSGSFIPRLKIKIIIIIICTYILFNRDMVGIIKHSDCVMRSVN